MAAIVVTAAQIAHEPTYHYEIYPADAAEAISAGQAVYINSNGKAAPASAAAAGTLIMAGISLNTVGAGQPISILKCGMVSGFTVSGLAYGDPVYVSDTAGGLDTVAGTVSKVIGRVFLINRAGAPVKVLYVQNDWN